MKNTLQIMVISIPILLLNLKTEAQVTVPANAGFPAAYVGWDALQLFPLTVAHKGDFPINFQTNGTQRMTIMNTTGYVGIRTATPIFPLDVRADGANNVTASGWKAGIHLSNHAALAWDNDATGKLIKSVDLTARGNGQINVFANDLSNGIYSYALVVDGQIADTKRMVKTQ